jgi:hypothetical protein
MKISQPNWIAEIYEIGSNAIEFFTSYENTGKPMTRFRLTAGRLTGNIEGDEYWAFLERETEIEVGGRKIRVWEIMDQVHLGHGPTVEACLTQTLLFLRSEDIL